MTRGGAGDANENGHPEVAVRALAAARITRQQPRLRPWRRRAPWRCRQGLLDARLLAFQATQVIQLAGADRAPALYLDRIDGGAVRLEGALDRSEEHKAELQSLMRTPYAVLRLK